MADKKVVIIGAGCAGLSAGYQLHKKGIEFVLLEASGHLGGRTGAEHFDPEHPDYYCSNGAVFTEPNNDVTFEYLEELGLMDLYWPIEKKVYGVKYDKGIAWMADDGNPLHALPVKEALSWGIVPEAAKFLKAFLRDAKGLTPQNLDILKDVSDQSISEWFKENVGEEMLDMLIGPMITAMTIGHPDNISVAHPLALLTFMSGMGQIKGSHEALNMVLGATFADSIRFYAPVEKILFEGTKVVGVLLASGEVIEADNVICCTDAVDAIAIAPDMPQDIKDALGTATYCSSWRYVFQFDRRITPENFMLMFLPMHEDRIISTMFDENLQGICGKPGTTLMQVFTVDWHEDELKKMTEEEREARVRKECAEILPAFATEGKVVSCQRYERGINLEPPGQFKAIHKMLEHYQEETEGLYLAGEWGYLVACTEGGYKTGKECALQLIEKLGR